MPEILIFLAALGVTIPYVALNFSNRLVLVYPLLAYIMLWPNLVDITLIKGNFGTIQVVDLFFIVFFFALLGQFVTLSLFKTVQKYWLPLCVMFVYVLYWVAQLLFMPNIGTIRAALNQFRSLAYFFFLLFLLLRIKDGEDVRKLIMVCSSLAIPEILLTLCFMAAHNNEAIKSILIISPDAYNSIYSDKLFYVFNLKCLFMVLPFLLNLIIIGNVFKGWGRRWQFMSLSSSIVLFALSQSRAMALVQIFGFIVGAALLYFKGALNLKRCLAMIPIGALLIGCVFLLLLAGSLFSPDLTAKLAGRVNSVTVSNIENYKKSDEMNSLKSRIESYSMLLSKLGDKVIMGKGLGAKIDPHGAAFERSVDSTYLMNVWSGGLVSLLLLLLLLLAVFWQSWSGYLMAKSPFEIYFFTSSTVSLIITYILALQDNILFFGNSVIMFLVVAAMVFVEKHECNTRGRRLRL